MSLALCVGAGAAIASGIAYYLAHKGVAYARTNPSRVKEPPLGTSPLAAFPWGKEAFMMQLLPPIMAFGAVVTAAAIAFTTPSGPITSLELARGPVLATALWVWGIFNCVSAQLKVKMGGGDDQAKRVAERSLYNTLEQGLPFLTCLWMSAACVDAAIASSIGVVYAAFRMFYGFTYAYYGGFSMVCEVITMPNYMAIHVLFASVLCFGLGGPSLFALPMLGQSFLLWTPLILLGNILFMVVVWDFPAAKAGSMVNLAYNSAAKAA